MKPQTVLTALFLAMKVNGEEQDSEIPGYTIEELEWNLRPSPEEPYVTVRGTVQEAVAQMVELNPDFGHELGLDNLTDLVNFVAGAEANVDLGQASKRAEPEDFKKVVCRKYPPANSVPIWDGVRYLERLSGSPANGPGPRACGRVSCSWNSAIFWCNDTKKRKTLDSWKSIANGARRVMTYTCQKWIPGSLQSWHVSGEAYHATGWTVIVRGVNC